MHIHYWAVSSEQLSVDVQKWPSLISLNIFQRKCMHKLDDMSVRGSFHV